jgi:hypothetical protein
MQATTHGRNNGVLVWTFKLSPALESVNLQLFRTLDLSDRLLSRRFLSPLLLILC